MEIKFNPDEPEEFIMVGDGRIQFGAVWVIPVGILLFLFGLGRIVVPLILARKQ